jgi:hypothetical protein
MKLRLSTVYWSLISWLIRWGSDSKHSHVELERADGWTLGARFSLRGKIARNLGWPNQWLHLDGVQWRRPDATQSNVVYFTYPGIEQAARWIEQNRLNAPYDLPGIIGIVTAKGWDESGDAFCSEVAQEAAVAVGLSGGKGFQNCSPQATKPRDIEISLAITKLNG